MVGANFKKTMIQKAGTITRHSIVKYDNCLYMIETNYNKGKVLLIPKHDSNLSGKEIKSNTELEVIAHPAQLAMEYLSNPTNIKTELEDFILEIKEYLEDRADADYENERYVPNKAMQLLSQIIQIENKLKTDKTIL